MTAHPYDERVRQIAGTLPGHLQTLEDRAEAVWNRWPGSRPDRSVILERLGTIEAAPVNGTAVQAAEPAPPRKPAIPSWTADELMALEFPPMRWAVDGVLAEGVNVLAGAPKFGKSWLALGLAVAVASGGRAFGTIPVEAGDVLYLALEDTGRRLQDRLRKLLVEQPAPARLRLVTGWDGLERIDAWLERTPGARLVVVDVLQRVRPTQLKGESSYTTDYRALEPWVTLAGQHSVCVLIVHHTRKAEGIDFVDEVSGTYGLSGAADAMLVARRARGSGAAVLKITGRDVEERELGLDFDARTGQWRLLDAPVGHLSLGDTRRRILVSLEQATVPLSPKGIARSTGLDYESVKKTVQRMADDGQIHSAGNGAYTSPSLVSPVSPSDPQAELDKG